MTCPTCGLPTVAPDLVGTPGVRYADSPGGHADRHTLVLEAAERVMEEEA